MRGREVGEGTTYIYRLDADRTRDLAGCEN
jgi:hypothetical protein